MKTKAIINRIDKSILAFINQLTEPYKDEYDVKMFYKILKGEQIQEGRHVFKIRIGSIRRLDHKLLNEELPPLPYNEFKLQIRLTSTVFHLMLTLFHNEENKTEGFSYHLDDTLDTGVVDETWVLPEGNHGRKPQLLFDEVLLLHKLNREMRITSELEPTQEIFEINQRFEKLMETATEADINWAITNELEIDEKIRILQYLNPDRKLQILNNINNGNTN